MTSPEPGHPSTGSPAGRERLVGLLALAIAAVLLLSSVTWFSSDRAGVGTGQLVLGLVLAGVGAYLVRRSRRR
jgi:hypothetical protein